MDGRSADLEYLLLRWSVETHNPISPPLEDVAMLIGLLMFGGAYMADFLDEKGKKKVEALQASLAKSKYSTKKATYLSWMKYFSKGEEGKNIPYQVDALLAYQMSYFMFPSPP